jgi:hypothetical protein
MLNIFLIHVLAIFTSLFEKCSVTLYSIYILDIHLILDEYLAKIFFHSLNCLFTVLIVWLCRSFQFDVITFIKSLAFVSWASRVLFRKSLSMSIFWNVCPCFILLAKSLSSYVNVFDLFWVNFCSGWEAGIEFQSLTCRYTVFPAPHVKETIFPRVMFFVLLSRIRWL